MPLPTPKPEESKDEFVSRCMSNESAKKEFESEDQRVAVCLEKWRKNKSNNSE